MIDRHSEYVLIEIRQLPRILSTFVVRRDARSSDTRALILAALAASDFDPLNTQTLNGELVISARGL